MGRSRRPGSEPFRPSRAEVAAAHGRTIPDVIGPGLRLLFVGINPGLYSGATGHHFARPGNRFWKALHGAGFTDHVYSPFDDRELLALDGAVMAGGADHDQDPALPDVGVVQDGAALQDGRPGRDQRGHPDIPPAEGVEESPVAPGVLAEPP